MSLPVAPCKDCKDRVLGCHSSCELYKDYQALMTELNKARRNQKESVVTDTSRKLNNKYMANRYDK